MNNELTFVTPYCDELICHYKIGTVFGAWRIKYILSRQRDIPLWRGICHIYIRFTTGKSLFFVMYQQCYSYTHQKFDRQGFCLYNGDVYILYSVPMKTSQSLKNILLVGSAILTFGFMSAFTIDTSINNALQIIKRIIITTSGTVTGSVVADLNTGNNNLYFNPSYLGIT